MMRRHEEKVKFHLQYKYLYELKCDELQYSNEILATIILHFSRNLNKRALISPKSHDRDGAREQKSIERKTPSSPTKRDSNVRRNLA